MPAGTTPGASITVTSPDGPTSLMDVFFAFDESTLSPEARRVLEQNAEYLRRNPHARIQIEGHADERGSTAYNLALGDRRATAAKQYLVSLGIDPSRISTISFGEEKPFAIGQNEEAWAQNRRGHFVEIK
ncbi:MAG TPA: peptidoglycan-associated lipoprotein Pal [Thermodesulfobacteriota bacterium]